MRLRRLGALLVAAAALALGVAAPAGATPPAYPPGGGGGGATVVITVDKTLVPLNGTVHVTVWNCQDTNPTLTVTGPGKAPGTPTQPFATKPGTIAGTYVADVTFQRVGRNTVSVTCTNGSAFAWVTVKAVTPVTVAGGGVLGETLQGGGGTAASLASLVKTGADAAGPVLIAALLLLAGFALLLVSRPRRRVRVDAPVTGRHRA